MNFKIRHILTPVDFSETSLKALEHAIFMAKVFEAKLSLIHVLEVLNYANEMNIPLIDNELSSVIRKRLDDLADSIHLNHGIIKPQVILNSGNIAETIVNTAEDIEADIILMGTHGASGWKEFLIGSNAYKVVTKASCPVLTIQKNGTKPSYRNIVLPIDDTVSSRQKVKNAVEFAQHYGSIIHVLGLITVDEPEVHSKFDVRLNQVNKYLDKHGVPWKNKIIVGDNIAKMTMNYAKEINADLIMIMTEQEENLTGFILGPYAQQVINHSSIPVLSVTPQEIFITEMVHPY